MPAALPLMTMSHKSSALNSDHHMRRLPLVFLGGWWASGQLPRNWLVQFKPMDWVKQELEDYSREVSVSTAEVIRGGWARIILRDWVPERIGSGAARQEVATTTLGQETEGVPGARTGGGEGPGVRWDGAWAAGSGLGEAEAAEPIHCDFHAGIEVGQQLTVPVILTPWSPCSSESTLPPQAPPTWAVPEHAP